MAPFRILSVDGGGIRGLIPALTIAELTRRLSARADKTVRLADYFHLFAGTSTGGLIVLGLTAPKDVTAERLADFYVVDGPKIFNPRRTGLLRKFLSAFGPLYGADSMRESVESRLGASRLSEARRELLVTAYDMTKRQPYFFKRWRARETSARDHPIVDAALATSAAPTYFPSHELLVPGDAEPHALVDGGVFADNPAVAAIAEAIALAGEESGERSPHDLFMVSFGTGRYEPRYRQSEVRGWGATRWVLTGGDEPPLISAMLGGSADGADYWAHMLLNHKAGDEPPGSNTIGRGPRYFRFQVELGEEIAMDDAGERVVKGLLPAAANRLIEDRAGDLDAVANELFNLGPIP